MYKQQTLTKLTTRSLSKIKTKVELAFTKRIINQNKEKDRPNNQPRRSNSVKSIANSTAERNLPFSSAIKNNLVQTDRKFSSYQLPVSNSRGRLISTEPQKVERKLIFQQKILQCKNAIKNQIICGYTWFHKDGFELISVSKKNHDQTLRYFAMKQPKSEKPQKKIIAAIENGMLYVGNKRYIICSNTEELPNKKSTQIELAKCDFVLIVDELIMKFTNLNRLITEVYELIADGVHTFDSIISILGRKIAETWAKNSKKQECQSIFILGVLLQKNVEALLKKKKDKKNGENCNHV